MKIDLTSIGKRVANARKAANMSLSDVHLATGIAQSSICRLEHGRSVPGAITLIILSTALGVSTDFLLGLKSQ